MSDSFESLSRSMAQPTSRRGVLKMMGGALVAGAAATVLKPFRADAVCPAGAPSCGSGCCAKGETCSDPSSTCCCPKGTTPCGTSCCNAGVSCANRATGLCGCPAGYTPCGSGTNLTCCPAGQACSSGCPTATSLASRSVAKTCGVTCPAPSDICSIPPCAANSNCVCFGGGICGDVRGLVCVQSPLCGPNGECASGFVCILSGDCCGPHGPNLCVPRCNVAGASAAAARSTSSFYGG
jgi:hypothetical protein